MEQKRPTKPETPEDGGLLPLVMTTDERQTLLKEQRRKEYNEFLNKVSFLSCMAAREPRGSLTPSSLHEVLSKYPE